MVCFHLSLNVFLLTRYIIKTHQNKDVFDIQTDPNVIRLGTRCTVISRSPYPPVPLVNFLWGHLWMQSFCVVNETHVSPGFLTQTKPPERWSYPNNVHCSGSNSETTHLLILETVKKRSFDAQFSAFDVLFLTVKVPK